MTENRFTYLLQRYLADQATPEETRELMKLVDSGAYDAELNSAIEAKLHAEARPAEIESPRANAILESILFKKKPETKTIYFTPLRIAAAIGAILIAATAIFWLSGQTGNRHLVTGNQTETLIQLTGSYTDKQYIKLPDGTAVTLNADSKLSYDFTNNTRTVKLEGEAYFDVAHDKTKPFKVYTGDVITEVLGTAFNINSDNNDVIVTVTRGKVQVGDAQQVYELLLPEQQLKVNAIDHTFEKLSIREQGVKEVTAWKKDFLILDNVTLAEAAKMISEQFNVEITITNSNIKTCQVNARFISQETLDEVLTMITSLNESTYTKEGNTIKIEGGVACNDNE